MNQPLAYRKCKKMHRAKEASLASLQSVCSLIWDHASLTYIGTWPTKATALGALAWEQRKPRKPEDRLPGKNNKIIIIIIIIITSKIIKASQDYSNWRGWDGSNGLSSTESDPSEHHLSVLWKSTFFGSPIISSITAIHQEILVIQMRWCGLIQKFL